MGVTSPQKDEVCCTFAEKIASLFREIPDFTENVETEWDLFKSAVIAFAAASRGCKRVGGHWVVKKELLGGTKKLKKLFVQRKLRLDLG